MKSLLKHPSAWLPAAMSLIVLALELGSFSLYGIVHETDEGTVAHLFQLLMAGQVPIVAFFAMTWLPRTPRQAIKVLVLQISLALAACAPVFYFKL